MAKFKKVEDNYPLSLQTSDRGHTRVTIRDLGSLDNAYNVQKHVKSLGYRDAFVYREVNGERIYANDPRF